MFREFSCMSGKGFSIALLAGAIVIVADVLLAGVIPLPVQVGFVAALFVARLAEYFYSHSCPWGKAVLEGAVLSVVGVLLLAADTALTSML